MFALRPLLIVLCFCVCANVASSEEQKALPNTGQFMSMLNACAAGSKTEFSGDLLGSVASIYAGERTKGSARLATETEFLKLLPSDKKFEGYRLYVECIKAIVNDPVAAKAKVQFAFLEHYTKDTPFEKVVEVFGQPSKRKQLFEVSGPAKDGSSYIDVFEFSGVNVNFYVIMSRKKRNMAAAVYVKQKPEQARIPYLNMGLGTPTKMYRTAADFRLREMPSICQDDKFSGAHARFMYIETNDCTFGAPGGYMTYRFVFQPKEQDFDRCAGVQVTDTTEYRKINCPSFNKLNPALSSVFFTDPPVSSDLSDVIMEWIYNFAQ